MWTTVLANFKAWALNRLSEKQTWVGLAGFATSMTGHALDPSLAPLIDMGAAGIVSAVLVIAKSAGSPDAAHPAPATPAMQQAAAAAKLSSLAILLLASGPLLGGCVPIAAGAGAGVATTIATNGAAAATNPVVDINAVLSAADIAYTTGSIALAGYEGLAPCGDASATKLCFNPTIDGYISTGLSALKKATADARLLLAANGDPTAIAATLVKATVDVLTILSQYGVK